MRHQRKLAPARLSPGLDYCKFSACTRFESIRTRAALTEGEKLLLATPLCDGLEVYRRQNIVDGRLTSEPCGTGLDFKTKRWPGP